ncbi:MAG: galactose-1-phosphate uridylyltransferase [Leptospiraceae bacterium]|nr:galactose-1-phosphate uridylyltransferase [Leptospiraceae bacterium]MCP5513487.1 galactose-1-phosphate uridylyltransferase [Leptospiraceae bacterium]
MSEIRQNIITRDWVIMATERAKRPHDFVSRAPARETLEKYKKDCPFCAGNEKDATEEFVRIDDESGNWQVRVIANKYPALSPKGDRIRNDDGLHRTISGIGIHDVVVESPEHDAIFAFMSWKHIYNILLSYKIRYNQIRNDRRLEAIVIFKNYGSSAGSSLEHTHSQIAATPVVPFQFRDRIQEAIRYFDDHGDCIVCRTLLDEISTQRRIVYENSSFLAFIPYAALTPFHVWIFPRMHSSSYGNISDEEMVDLASILKTVLLMLHKGLGDPDYNFTIRTAPLADNESRYFHWYLSIIPRITKNAGFELGSGMFINSALPEESAEYLRNLDLSDTDNP